ncbi:transporter protein [Secundilactobacillus odoratitofui DSM 19909 = JCM 15043]|uniref:Putative proline/betaine transporter n=1 Tax=Secundilactobacillus odoratitofui DSM 19909 = JCM 15043 TaxID=1423776 RepID=A0A0R1LYI5_9LACO|nr:MFS transporter [Secundilactobacillus odoratitofui]KRK97514.1 transporter protein [Secundilactobacillus odoratitofui DSM 19909 = JCM 15043]
MAQRSARTEKQIAANIFKGSLGNMIEWFDWYVYASFAIYFSAAFFPAENKTAELLSTAAVFAVGFLMRPLGSFIMGRFADRKGRRAALTLSVTIMATGSLVIAVTPGFKVIGVWSPLILVVTRLFQGLSLGGEYGTSATYLSEMASPKRRGFYSSFQYVTLISGQLFALLVQIVLQSLLSNAQLYAFGWRIPFVIGALGAVAVLWLRLSMEESDQFTAKNKHSKKAGTLTLLAKYPKQFFTVVGLTFGGTIAFYAYTTYLQKFMINTTGLNTRVVSVINFFALLVMLILQPIFGAISDKIGRKPMLLWFGIGGTLFTVPIFSVLAHVHSPWAAFFLMLTGVVIVSGYTSINAIVKAELFPTEIRALGVGFPYGLTVAIFGGTVEYVALWLRSANMESLFFYYVAFASFVSLVVYWRMLETSSASEINVDSVTDAATGIENGQVGR